MDAHEVRCTDTMHFQKQATSDTVILLILERGHALYPAQRPYKEEEDEDEEEEKEEEEEEESNKEAYEEEDEERVPLTAAGQLPVPTWWNGVLPSLLHRGS